MKQKTITLLLICAALATISPRAQVKTRPNGDVRSYPVPAGISKLVAISICAAGDAILFWAPIEKSPNKYALFALNLKTGTAREIFRGAFGHIYPAPSMHLFALDTHNGNQGELVLLKHDGTVLGRVNHPDSGAFFFPLWDPESRSIVFTRERPDLPPDSPDYDPYGFTAIGILEVNTLKQRWFSIHPTGYSHWLVYSDKIPWICIMEDRADLPSQVRFVAYGLDGKKLARGSPIARQCRSSGRRFYASHQWELPNSFRIYDATSGRIVMRFPDVDPQTGDLNALGEWNPKYDDLIVIERRDTRNEITWLDVYSLTLRKSLRTLPGSEYAWFPDGRALVVFRDGLIVFEPFNP